MRQALATLLAGEALLVGGIAAWSVPAACVALGGQLVAFALLREPGKASA